MALNTMLNIHLSGSSVRNNERNNVASRRRKRSKKSRKSKKGITCMQFLDIMPNIGEIYLHRIISLLFYSFILGCMKKPFAIFPFLAFIKSLLTTLVLVLNGRLDLQRFSPRFVIS